MRVVTLRLDEAVYRELEAVRQQEGVRSHSELIRRAIKQFLAAQRRQERLRDLAAYAQDRANLKAMAEFADANFLEAMARIDREEEAARRCSEKTGSDRRRTKLGKICER